MKRMFKNIAKVALAGKQAGEKFFLAVQDDGETPIDLYWRKRINEGAVLVLDKPETKAAKRSESAGKTLQRKGN